MKKVFLLSLAIAMLLCSCNKEHYDTSHIQGVQVDGELLLPLASASYTIGDLLKDFQIDSLLSFEEGGNMWFTYNYQQEDIFKGSDFLKFNGFELEEHFAFENPFPIDIPVSIDTLIKFSHSVQLNSDFINLNSGRLRSGILSLGAVSNIAQIDSVVIHSSEIKDASNEELNIKSTTIPVEVDLAGLHFDMDPEADTANVLNFDYELYVSINNTSLPEFAFDFQISSTEIEVQEMTGNVISIPIRYVIDTVFSLFSGGINGALELKGAELALLVRNGFDLTARMEVDTAWLMCEGLPNFNIFNVMPMVAEIKSHSEEPSYYDAINTTLNARVNSNAIGAYVTSDFIFNPNGLQDEIYVSDTSTIDIGLDLNVPLKFCIDDVTYLDTLEFSLSDVESVDMIEKLTLDVTMNSTIPLNLNGKFYLYDSEHNIIVDTLNTVGRFIEGSFDGLPKRTDISFEITERKIDNALRSDRILMWMEVDTDAHDAVLNTNQGLDVFLKARVKYNDLIELN